MNKTYWDCQFLFDNDIAYIYHKRLWKQNVRTRNILTILLCNDLDLDVWPWPWYGTRRHMLSRSIHSEIVKTFLVRTKCFPFLIIISMSFWITVMLSHDFLLSLGLHSLIIAALGTFLDQESTRVCQKHIILRKPSDLFWIIISTGLNRKCAKNWLFQMIFRFITRT